MPGKDRPNSKQFRDETYSHHKSLFGHIFCRIGGRGYDANGQEIRLDCHHAGETYKKSPESTGDKNGLLIGRFCHQEIIHAGHGAETALVQDLSKRFKANPNQATYPIDGIDCSQCGKRR